MKQETEYITPLKNKSKSLPNYPFKKGDIIGNFTVLEDDYVYQDFAFYMKDKVIQEHHIQRVYDPKWLDEILSKYFEILKVTTDFDIEGIAPGEKYFYVCRKKVQE